MEAEIRTSMAAHVQGLPDVGWSCNFEAFELVASPQGSYEDQVATFIAYTTGFNGQWYRLRSVLGYVVWISRFHVKDCQVVMEIRMPITSPRESFWAVEDVLETELLAYKVQ